MAQLLRYSAVSGISTVTSLTILGVLVGVFGVDAVLANVLATAVGTVPSFELNRRWVWFDQSQRSVLRQVTPFCTLSFAGLVLSTLTVRFVSARTVDLSRGWHTLAVEAANVSAYGALWVVQFVLLDRVLFRPRRALSEQGAAPVRFETGDEAVAPSGDDASLPELSQFVRTQAQLVSEDIVGVLAEPGHPGLGTLGHFGELHREPRDQHGLCDAVGPRMFDEHVAPGQVRVRHHLLVVGHRPGHETGGVQRIARLSFGEAGGPGLQGGPDVRLEVVEPTLGRGEARVVGPLRPTDGASEVGPLVRAQHLQHEPAVGGPEAVQDPGPRGAHRHPHGPEVGHDVEDGDECVEHGDVDALPPSGAVALTEGGLGADDGEESRHDVPQPAHR
jgi:putative flippase GtrA